MIKLTLLPKNGLLQSTLGLFGMSIVNETNKTIELELKGTEKVIVIREIK